MGELKLWRGECDLVIAESAEEAATLAQAETGVEDDPDLFDEWKRPTITIHDEEEGPTEYQVASLIAERGRGWWLGFEP